MKMINVVIRGTLLCDSDRCVYLGTLCPPYVNKLSLHPFEFLNGLLPSSRCIVPNLHVVNTEVDFGRCFLKYPYKKTIQLVNDDNLPGCYRVLPQASYSIRFQCCFSFS